VTRRQALTLRIRRVPGPVIQEDIPHRHAHAPAQAEAVHRVVPDVQVLDDGVAHQLERDEVIRSVRVFSSVSGLEIVSVRDTDRGGGLVDILRLPAVGALAVPPERAVPVDYVAGGAVDVDVRAADRDHIARP
jgi:hypothetical protein